MDLENATLRDFLLLTLFTGLRREEAARLRWANVDLKGRTLTVPNTKNGEPHTLPLSGFLLELLERRKEGAGRDAVFVFPGGGVAGHIVEPRATMKKVTEQCGAAFTQTGGEEVKHANGISTGGVSGLFLQPRAE